MTLGVDHVCICGASGGDRDVWGGEDAGCYPGWKVVKGWWWVAAWAEGGQDGDSVGWDGQDGLGRVEGEELRVELAWQDCVGNFSLVCTRGMLIPYHAAHL